MKKSPIPKPEIIGKYTIRLNGSNIEYMVQRSHRARLVRLVISSGSGLSVTVPWRYNVDNLTGILEKKQNWIIRKHAQHREPAKKPVKRQFNTGDSIPYLGETLRLLVQSRFDGAVMVKRKQDTLTIAFDDKKLTIESVLGLWYKMEANRIIQSKTENISARMGVHYGVVRIRGQRTRWGSCSRKGNLSFNWKLTMAPDAVIDYVIIHELAHLKEMNHSVKFWQVVSTYCPEFKQHRKWLKDHDVEMNIALPFK
jgi:hypothetical protein